MVGVVHISQVGPRRWIVLEANEVRSFDLISQLRERAAGALLKATDGRATASG